MNLLKDLVAELTPVTRLEPTIQSRWIYPWWRIDGNDAGRMLKWLEMNRSRNVVETGTFEAQGTAMIAKTMASYGGGTLTTFDQAADAGDLGITSEQWADLTRIRYENLELIRKTYPTVVLRYVEGDTRDTLLKADLDGPVDFWFQDTMHFLTGIVSEIEAMGDRMAPGGLIVFDDIGDTHPLHDWVREHRLDGWFHHHFADGCGQLWSQKPR